MKLVWIALRYNRPIVSASSFKGLKVGLNEYYNIGIDPKSKCLGYKTRECNYPDDLDGYYEYECDDQDGGVEVERIEVYCIDFYQDMKS